MRTSRRRSSMTEGCLYLQHSRKRWCTLWRASYLSMHRSKEGWKYIGGAFPGREKIALPPASFASSFGKRTRSGTVVALRQKRSSRVLERRHFIGLRERLLQACNISGGQRAWRSVRSVLSLIAALANPRPGCWPNFCDVIFARA
jgi:hypothetical protein